MFYHTDSIYLNARRWALTVAVALMAAGALSACNTVEGAGRDIEATGEAVQDAAD